MTAELSSLCVPTFLSTRKPMITSSEDRHSYRRSVGGEKFPRRMLVIRHDIPISVRDIARPRSNDGKRDPNARYDAYDDATVVCSRARAVRKIVIGDHASSLLKVALRQGSLKNIRD